MSIWYILVLKAHKYINIKNEFVTPECSLRVGGGGYSLETGEVDRNLTENEHSFSYSFNKCLLTTYCVLSIEVGAGRTPGWTKRGTDYHTNTL